MRPMPPWLRFKNVLQHSLSYSWLSLQTVEGLFCVGVILDLYNLSEILLALRWFVPWLRWSLCEGGTRPLYVVCSLHFQFAFLPWLSSTVECFSLKNLAWLLQKSFLTLFSAVELVIPRMFSSASLGNYYSIYGFSFLNKSSNCVFIYLVIEKDKV